MTDAQSAAGAHGGSICATGVAEHVPNSVEIPCGSRFTLGNLTFGVN
jgi:hypothetical protein